MSLFLIACLICALSAEYVICWQLWRQLRCLQSSFRNIETYLDRLCGLTERSTAQLASFSSVLSLDSQRKTLAELLVQASASPVPVSVERTEEAESAELAASDVTSYEVIRSFNEPPVPRTDRE